MIGEYRLYRVLSIAVGLLILPLWSAAQEESVQIVETEGLGSIMNNDVANARDQAVNDAQRNAVEQAVGVMIWSETVVENFMLTQDVILSNTSGYVAGYEVMDEGQEDDYTYKVTIRATVKTGKLREDGEAIASIIERVGKPRIMVLMDEQIVDLDGTATSLGLSEIAIMNTFLKKSEKFDFLDPSTVQANLDKAQARAAINGDVGAAAAIARMNGADAIIVGNAQSKKKQVEAFNLKIEKSDAKVSARVIWADTGRIITSSTSSAFKNVGVELQTGVYAIEEASTQLAGNLMEPILEHWRAMLFSGRTVQLILRNVASFSQLGDLETTLKYAIRGVKKLQQRTFDSGVVVYDIDAESSAQQIARELETKDLGSFKIKVESVTMNKIEAALVRP